jgi:hypothetical protein
MIEFLDGNYTIERVDNSNIVLDKLVEKKTRKHADGTEFGGGTGWKRLGFFDKPKDALARLIDDAIMEEIGSEDDIVEIQKLRHNIIKMGKRLEKQIEQAALLPKVPKKKRKDSDEEEDD